MTDLEEYYNKFNEDKRLKSRHGQVEFEITMSYVKKYIDKYIREKCATNVENAEVDAEVNIQNLDICDIGAGCGAYSIPLAKEGHKLISFDLVQHNIGRVKKYATDLKLDITCYKRDARKLKMDENIADITLLLGPMYHLHTLEDKRDALSEAIRITRPGGYIFVAYVMNEYGVLTYGFKEKHIMENVKGNRLDNTFHIKTDENDLYDYVRIEDIDAINEGMAVEREVILSPDGPANHMRPVLNSLSNDEFKEFIRYQKTVCERMDLLGASAHTVDVLRVIK